MSLLDKLSKNSTLKNSAVFSQSNMMASNVSYSTKLKVLNVAFSGSLDGGFGSGLTQFAGPSKHFKCVDGDTEIEVYSEHNKPDSLKTVTYKELHDSMNADPDNEYYVKTPTGYSLVNVSIKKLSDTYTLKFDNGYEITVGDRHAFMDTDGKALTAEDIVPGDLVNTISGKPLKVLEKHSFKENQEVYDISIDAPHWYTNSMESGGIIHHNTMLMLLCAAAFLRDEPEGVVVFYDNEFGASSDYFESLGIDTDRVFHIPFMHIEDLKFDMVKKLEAFDRKDKVMIIIDSIGNAASKKEVEDAKDEKSVADMTRAKAIKSLWRIVTPYLTMKDIPCIVINHVYSTQSLYSTTVVSGGCVVEGTKIKTPTGLKAVEDFKPGDTVLTLEGEKEVTHTWYPDTLEEGTPECYEIEFSDGYTVTCSASHKFLLAKDKWVEAKDLTENMFIDILLTDSRKIRSSLKIKSIKNVGRKNVYDLSVQDVEHYVLENGVVTHNSGIMYSSNNVFIIGRSQVKDGRDVVGYDFKINIEKSRGCREKSVLPFTVTYDGGINEYAGLFELARELGYIKMVSSGWYSRVLNGEVEDKKWRLKDAEFDDEFWKPILESDFNETVKSRFKLVSKASTGVEENDIELDKDIDV